MRAYTHTHTDISICLWKKVDATPIWRHTIVVCFHTLYILYLLYSSFCFVPISNGVSKHLHLPCCQARLCMNIHLYKSSLCK